MQQVDLYNLYKVSELSWEETVSVTVKMLAHNYISDTLLKFQTVLMSTSWSNGLDKPPRLRLGPLCARCIPIPMHIMRRHIPIPMNRDAPANPYS